MGMPSEDVHPLRKERLRKGWKQRQLADFAQIGLSAVERAEGGKSISLENVQRLCGCLGKSPEQLGLVKLPQEALAGGVGISEIALAIGRRTRGKPEAKNLQKLLEVFLDLGIFTAGKEEEEARAFWLASRVNVVFDEVWHNALANTRKPKPEKKGQVDPAPSQLVEMGARAEVDLASQKIGQEELTPQASSSKLLVVQEDTSQLDTASPPPQASVASSSRLWLPKAPTLRDFIVGDMNRCLLQIAHTDYSASDEMTAAIQAAIKEYNRMNTNNPTYEITRRDAICELASLPMIALGSQQTMHAKHYGDMLRHCTAALEACWQLYRGSDPIGIRYAFDCVCTYVPLIETIARDSAQYRKEALDLAAQYALLQTLLGWNCVGVRKTIPYARNARSLSKATGNILFLLGAYSKLSWAYLRGGQYTKSWETMQEGEYALKEYQHQKNRPPLLSGVIGNFYSSYATAQVNNGLLSDTALGIATDSEPLKGPLALIEFTASTQWLEAAWTCCYKGNHKQARMWLEKRIDSETFAPLPSVPQSKNGRIESVNILTRALLQSEERDMERIIAAWTAGMEGAQVLKGEERYQEAMTNFEIMRTFWPNEQAIIKLLPLTVHWSEEAELEA
jgi:transcriptional regulator with XRE-family HTH domain